MGSNRQGEGGACPLDSFPGPRAPEALVIQRQAKYHGEPLGYRGRWLC